MRLGRIAFLYVKLDPALYSQIIRDDKISHGAFRLWHLLRDMTGANACCWPSVETISKLIHCGKDSVLLWLVELEASGYLRIERGHRHKSNRYFVGGRKENHGGSIQGIIGGPKRGMESIPIIESNTVGVAAKALPDPDKPELNSLPTEAAAALFRQMRETL